MVQSQISERLAQLIYFEDLPASDLQMLAQSSVARSFSAGQIIFHAGDPATGLWIIEKGRIKITRINPEGDEHILHILGVGDTFNDIAVLDAGNNPANAIALSAATVRMIPSDIITHLIESNGQFALKMVRVLAKRTRSLVGQIESLALYSVIVRLSRFLLKQSEEPNLSGPGITRTAIAAHINTTPQTISVALKQLETAGAIEFDRHRIIIIDEEKLQTIALLV